MFDYLSGLEIPYRGVLYVGLMITDTGEPNVVEFNVRFGDPECQITIPMIKTDLFEVLDKTARDKLSHVDVKFHQAHALTVVLASEGYPSNPVKNREISGSSLAFRRLMWAPVGLILLVWREPRNGAGHRRASVIL